MSSYSLLVRRNFMPDLDLINTKPAARWRRPCQLLQEPSASDEIVADAASHALRESLRREGGIPALPELHDLVAVFNLGGKTLFESLEACRQVEQRHGHDRHTRVASQAAKRILVEIEGGRIRKPTMDDLAIRSCMGLADHQILSHAHTVDNAGKRLDLPRRKERILGLLAEDAAIYGSALVRNPNGKNIPKAVRLKKKTTELMNTPL